MSDAPVGKSEEGLDRLVSAAREVHDKCPADHAGDHWPIANLVMQQRLVEEQASFQKKLLEEQDRRHRELVAKQEAHQTESSTEEKIRHSEMLRNQNQMLVATWVLIALTFLFSWLSDRRTSQLFMAERRPQIDVTPIAVMQNAGTNTATFVSIANYSGFDAFEISIDVRYEVPNNKWWIGEWVKARENSNAGGLGVQKNRKYDARPSPLILDGPKKLSAGEIVEPTQPSVSALDLKENVCDTPSGSIPAFVRVRWRGDNGHFFDEVHRYTLLCTKDQEGGRKDRGTGRAFTFIPNGIMSMKSGEFK